MDKAKLRQYARDLRVCIEKRLIIELDGGQHQSNQAYDAHRTTELNKRGFQVLRFWNNDVL